MNEYFIVAMQSEKQKETLEQTAYDCERFSNGISILVEFFPSLFTKKWGYMGTMTIFFKYV
jgi:hypothetical protein